VISGRQFRSRSHSHAKGNRYLVSELLWGPDDPLFPRTRVAQNDNLTFEAVGMERVNWSNAGPIRKILKEAFEAVGLPYFNPHSFRKTLAQFGERICNTAEEFKAWSQNLGHENVLTTYLSYGEVASRRQAEIIRRLGEVAESEADELELIESALKAAKRRVRG